MQRRERMYAITTAAWFILTDKQLVLAVLDFDLLTAQAIDILTVLNGKGVDVVGFSDGRMSKVLRRGGGGLTRIVADRLGTCISAGIRRNLRNSNGDYASRVCAVFKEMMNMHNWEDKYFVVLSPQDQDGIDLAALGLDKYTSMRMSVAGDRKGKRLVTEFLDWLLACFD